MQARCRKCGPFYSWKNTGPLPWPIVSINYQRAPLHYCKFHNGSTFCRWFCCTVRWHINVLALTAISFFAVCFISVFFLLPLSIVANPFFSRLIVFNPSIRFWAAAQAQTQASPPRQGFLRLYTSKFCHGGNSLFCQKERAGQSYCRPHCPETYDFAIRIDASSICTRFK